MCSVLRFSSTHTASVSPVVGRPPIGGGVGLEHLGEGHKDDVPGGVVVRLALRVHDGGGGDEEHPCVHDDGLGELGVGADHAQNGLKRPLRLLAMHRNDEGDGSEDLRGSNIEEGVIARR